MKKSFIVHPFLFSIFPYLFFFSNNKEQMSISEIAMPMAITTFITVILWGLLSFILKNKEKSGLVISLSLLLFFSYGHFSNVLGESFHFAVGSLVIGTNKLLLFLWALFFFLGTYYSIKTRRDLYNFTHLLNIVAACMIFVSLSNVGIYKFRAVITKQNINITETAKPMLNDLGNSSSLPDIYYIILDSYANAGTLKEIWNYDNHEFIDYLTDKGFYVASKSRSNYVMSYISMASSLNMEYLNYLREPKDTAILYKMVVNNKVMQFLKSHGYKFVHFKSGWGATDANKNADIDIQCGRWNEFMRAFIETTMLNPFMKYFVVFGDDIRERVLCIFSTLAEVKYKIGGPRFVFAHIVSPHMPYVFGPNGELVDEKLQRISWEDEQSYQNYLNQLIFINKKVKEFIEKILSEADTPPIIILQADHGPRFFHEIEKNRRKVLRLSTGILNAYYFPGKTNTSLYESITPVNTFRSIFNLYFKGNYDLLDDKMYFSNFGQPYKFTDVTKESAQKAK